MRRVIYPLLLILLLCCGTRLAAQQYYKVSTTAGTYKDLGDPIVLFKDSVQMLNEFAGAGVLTPFTMKLFGQTLDFNQNQGVSFFTGGFIAIALPTTQRLYVFDGFVSKLTWRDSTTSVSVMVEGSPGERILKAQWKNMGMSGNSAGDFVNMQIWLYEKDNSFEVHVGPSHVTGTAGYYTKNGPAIGGFIGDYNLTTADAAIHLTGDPAHPGVDETQIYYPLSSTPPNGTTYRFAYSAGAASVGTAANETAAAVVFFPNPAHDRSRIQLPEALQGAGATMILHDVLGREVRRVDNVFNGDYFERGALPAGVYYVTLQRAGRTYNGGTLVVAN